MADQYQGGWSDILPWVLLARRTSYHSDLEATPAQMLYGEDPPLPGELRPIHHGETLQQILGKAQANAHRPLAQTRHKETKSYMPPFTQTATHVMTKKAKYVPLESKWDGPYLIKQRLGDSALKLLVGHFANGRERTEIRHWNSCYPLDPNSPLPTASKPSLGRKPLNAEATPFIPDPGVQEMDRDFLQAPSED